MEKNTWKGEGHPEDWGLFGLAARLGDLGSLTRDGLTSPAGEVQSLNHWISRKSLLEVSQKRPGESRLREAMDSL